MSAPVFNVTVRDWLSGQNKRQIGKCPRGMLWARDLFPLHVIHLTEIGKCSTFVACGCAPTPHVKVGSFFSGAGELNSTLMGTRKRFPNFQGKTFLSLKIYIDTLDAKCETISREITSLATNTVDKSNSHLLKKFSLSLYRSCLHHLV